MTQTSNAQNQKAREANSDMRLDSYGWNECVYVCV